MSRPTTRGKNKRPKQEKDSDVTSAILRRIHTTGEVVDDDVNKLYMITKPACQGCRVNTKDNPNCFCGLVPPPNGSRKAGLWQKTSEILQALGPDPSSDLRPSSKTPAGLTNLGATCYANSILQFLYMNKSFRQGLFSVEPDVLRQQPVLDQLARLFAQLHASDMAFIDSAPFIKTLELDNAVQQDGHEFLTLLLSLLERCLMHSKVPMAETIVQDLFRGRVSNVIKCSKCGRDSEASAKMEDFYELELNVKGLKGLDESLDDYLGVEELRGDNQYFCMSCETRVDATRSIKLRTLPDVLIFQLKRYVFHAKTSTKKKISSAFCFPRELDMQKRLSERSQLGWMYDLSAVLIHKGSGANSGHYIAHIKDENTGQWWEFDDEHVSSLGNHAFGEGSSGSTARSAQNGASNENLILHSSKSDGDNQTEIFSSTDAYMLMYSRRSAPKEDDKRPIINDASGSEVDDLKTSLNDGFPLPSHLFEDIKNMNASYLDACQQYKIRKESEMNCIAERRQEVRSVLSEAPARSLEEPFYWVSTDWLRQWADNITPPVIDNSSIQCLHGKVPASKVCSMKRLSAKAWIKLYTKYNGGPTLTKDDCCMVCIIGGAKSVVSADSYRDRRIQMRDLASNVIAGTCLGGTYYVSRTWLQQWVRRKNLDAPCEADTGPTVPITCPHGQLMPEQAPGAKRMLVPENLWLFFYEDSIAVKPDDPTDCPTFPLDSEPCPQCNDELSEVACMEYSLRAEKLKQRKNHEKLAMGKSISLSLDCRYYLVPSSWVTNWRNYVNASGKTSSPSLEPQPIDLVIDSLKCEKHARLIQRPPDLVCKRGILFQKGSTTDGLAIITEDDWNSFCEEWGGDREKGISVKIEFSSTTETNINGTCEEMVTSEEDQTTLEAKNDSQTRQPIIRTFPEVCEDCIGERESCELVQKLNYCNEDINVTFVRGKEAPKSFLEAADSTFEPDRRASKRSRRTGNRNSVNLKVSGSTSVYQLKMMIWESLGVIKENQILRKGPRLLDQESATLADMNIFPGDKLWVQDSEIHEQRDIADELADQKADTRDTKEGFHGTLLSSDASSQV